MSDYLDDLAKNIREQHRLEAIREEKRVYEKRMKVELDAKRTTFWEQMSDKLEADIQELRALLETELQPANLSIGRNPKGQLIIKKRAAPTINALVQYEAQAGSICVEERRPETGPARGPADVYKLESDHDLHVFATVGQRVFEDAGELARAILQKIFAVQPA